MIAFSALKQILVVKSVSGNAHYRLQSFKKVTCPFKIMWIYFNAI